MPLGSVEACGTNRVAISFTTFGFKIPVRLFLAACFSWKYFFLHNSSFRDRFTQSTAFFCLSRVYYEQCRHEYKYTNNTHRKKTTNKPTKKKCTVLDVDTPRRVLISFRSGEGENPPVLMGFGAEALNRINEVEQSHGPVSESSTHTPRIIHTLLSVSLTHFQQL